ncbi:hypothetical protein [Dactylosporangium salmoneum]|uniref:Uncharacterized protein n=1 Tax=Dactylosporangium salmoneum TaxID=53361 RepID=A0ABN3GAX4_9ACTN
MTSEASRLTKERWYQALKSTQAGGFTGLAGETFLAIRELGNDVGTPITPDVIDRITARLGPQNRDLALDLLDAMDQHGWLIRMDLDRYEFAIPSYARPLPTPGKKPVFAVERAASHQKPVAVQARASAPIVSQGVQEERRCALYRWRDQKQALLYVGITEHVATRSYAHAATSIWWAFARRQDVEWFPSRAEAEVAERAAIRSEAPIFNKAHNASPEAAQRVVEYLTLRKRLDLLPAKLAA